MEQFVALLLWRFGDKEGGIIELSWGWMWWFGREENLRRVKRVGGGWLVFKNLMLWALEGDHGGSGSFLSTYWLVPSLGDRILFWQPWCGVTPLKSLFPVLFSCSSDKLL
uniref:Reverse transcriptase zinc-binding domain-containing protein n=1 Tax=Fagus sylvatica TaxID=28930 RepID=A0A2N9HWV9_FAGSY